MTVPAATEKSFQSMCRECLTLLLGTHLQGMFQGMGEHVMILCAEWLAIEQSRATTAVPQQAEQDLATQFQETGDDGAEVTFPSVACSGSACETLGLDGHMP